MNDVLVANGAGTEEIKNKLVPNGEHAEWFWRQEFQEAIEWLLFDQAANISSSEQQVHIHAFPRIQHNQFARKSSETGFLEERRSHRCF